MEQTPDGEHQVHFDGQARVCVLTSRAKYELQPQTITIPFAVLKFYVAQILTHEAENAGGLAAVVKAFVATFLEEEAAQELGPKRESPPDEGQGPKLVAG